MCNTVLSTEPIPSFPCEDDVIGYYQQCLLVCIQSLCHLDILRWSVRIVNPTNMSVLSLYTCTTYPTNMSVLSLYTCTTYPTNISVLSLYICTTYPTNMSVLSLYTCTTYPTNMSVLSLYTCTTYPTNMSVLSLYTCTTYLVAFQQIKTTLVRNDMDVNEHQRLSNTKLLVKEQTFYCRSTCIKIK